MNTYCPNCDKMVNATVKTIEENYNVKGEKISISSEVAYCINCNNSIFVKELDEVNLQKAFSAYRGAHDLLSAEEIKEIRKKYGLSQKNLALVLGWGEVTITRYENGAVQSPAHNEILRFISDPTQMKVFFERNRNILEPGIRGGLDKRLSKLINEEFKPEKCIQLIEEYWSSGNSINEFSGFVRFDSTRLKQMIIYITDKAKGVFTTKLNKLLFYVDFYNCKKHSKSISGATYVHLDWGPVPNDFKWILLAMQSEGLIKEEEVDFGNYCGTEYKSLVKPNVGVFSSEELETIDFIVDYFKNMNSTQIKDLSHKEIAYSGTMQNSSISYKYASELSIPCMNS